MLIDQLIAFIQGHSKIKAPLFCDSRKLFKAMRQIA